VITNLDGYLMFVYGPLFMYSVLNRTAKSKLSLGLMRILVCLPTAWQLVEVWIILLSLSFFSFFLRVSDPVMDRDVRDSLLFVMVLPLIQ